MVVLVLVFWGISFFHSSYTIYISTNSVWGLPLPYTLICFSDKSHSNRHDVISHWIKKAVYVYKGILLSHKKDESFFVTTWIDLEGIMLNEIIQMEKDKYQDFTHVEYKALINKNHSFSCVFNCDYPLFFYMQSHKLFGCSKKAEENILIAVSL